jgi:hypothetical protein
MARDGSNHGVMAELVPPFLIDLYTEERPLPSCTTASPWRRTISSSTRPATALCPSGQGFELLGEGQGELSGRVGAALFDHPFADVELPDPCVGRGHCSGVVGHVLA